MNRTNLINEISQYGSLQDGWDDEDSVPPTQDMIKESLALVDIFPEHLIPTSMLKPNGCIGFYWHRVGFYADLQNEHGEFSVYLSNNHMSYFKDHLKLSDLTFDWFIEHIKI